MNAPAASPPARGLKLLLPAWLGLSLALGFLALGIALPAGPPGDPQAVVAAWSAFLGPAAFAAMLVCGALAWTGREDFAGRLLVGALGAYLACLIVTGLPGIVAGALVASLGLCVATRPGERDPGMLLLLHAMGTIGGLYVIINLHRYLAAGPAFRDILRALKWLVVP